LAVNVNKLRQFVVEETLLESEVLHLFNERHDNRQQDIIVYIFTLLHSVLLV